MAAFGTDQEVRHKGPDQPVTDADLAADALLAERLLADRADYGWLSEETVDRPARLERRRVWVVDPIDGTRSFIAGYPEFAISIGLVEDGRPVVGVIHNPARDEMFWALRGEGAFLREGGAGGEARRLAVAPLAGGTLPSLLASRSELRRGEFDGLQDHEIHEVGSTAYKMAGVAAGRAHAFLSRGPKSEWDVAAGTLIVQEAGGVVTDLGGRDLRFNRADTRIDGILAAGPGAHAGMLRRPGRWDESGSGTSGAERESA